MLCGVNQGARQLRKTRSIFKFVAIGLVLSTLVALAAYFGGPTPVYCQQSFTERDQKVVMFSSRFCPYCRQARILFTQHNIRYCEYSVNASNENQQAFETLGGIGVPLIVIGDEVFYGFNETIITAELERQGYL
jgi:glutaredoxin